MRESLALIVLVFVSFGAGYCGRYLVSDPTVPSLGQTVLPQNLPNTPDDSPPQQSTGSNVALIEELTNFSSQEQQIDFLRSAGFPDDGILILLSGVVGSDEQSERFWIPTDYPWWKSWHGPPQLTPQEIENWQKPYRDLRSKMGAAGLRPVDKREAEHRFGIVDPEKIFRLRVIRDDYTLIERRIGAMPEEEQFAAYELMRDERSRDIQALLSAEEFAIYDFRTSPGIQSLEHQLRDIEFTVDEFEALIPTWSVHSPEVRGYETNKSSDQDDRIAKLLVDEQVRETLGEARFWDYKVGNDQTFKLLAAFVEQHDLPRGQVLSLWDEYVATEVGESSDSALVDSESSERKRRLQARVIEVWGNGLFEKAREYGRLSWLVGSSEGEGE